MNHPTFSQAQKLAPKFLPPSRGTYDGSYRSWCTEDGYRGTFDGPPQYMLVCDHDSRGWYTRAYLDVNAGETVYHYRAGVAKRMVRCDADTWEYGWDA